MLRSIFLRLILLIGLLHFVLFVIFALVTLGEGYWIDRSIGPAASPAQRESFRAQLGWDQSLLVQHVSWLAGNDWWLDQRVGYPLVAVTNADTDRREWWANVDGALTRWTTEDEELVALVRQPDGSVAPSSSKDLWTQDRTGTQSFWGVSVQNRAVLWRQDVHRTNLVQHKGLWREERNSEVKSIPITKGIIRGDFGESLRTGLPIAGMLSQRAQNSVLLLGVVIVFALAVSFLVPVRRWTSRQPWPVACLRQTFVLVAALFVVLCVRLWLGVQPAISPFESDSNIWKPGLLVMPVGLLTLLVVGVLLPLESGQPTQGGRLEQAMVRSTILMLLEQFHLIAAALLVLEVMSGFPGIGRYLYRSVSSGDVTAVLAVAACLTVVLIGTRFLRFLLRMWGDKM